MAKPGLSQHPKFRRLVHLLQEPAAHVRGYLECMWEVCYQEGNPLLGDSVDVELAAGYPGKPGRLTEALLAVRFIDETEAGRYEVHDLLDHAPDYVRKRAARVASRKIGNTHAKNERVAAERRTTADSDRRSAALTAQPSPAQPSGEEPPTPKGGNRDAVPKNRSNAAKAVPIPEPLRSAEFLAAWAEWLDDRLERRKPMTAGAARQQLAKLIPLGPERAAECVRLSIQNSWAGIFPERFSQQHGTGPPPRVAATQETVAEKLARLQASGQVPTV